VAGERRMRRRRHLEGGVVAALDVVEPEDAEPKAAIYRRAGINSPRRMAGRPSAVAFTARGRRCARGRPQCAEDEMMRTTITHSHRQVGATRRPGIFVAFLRAFLSSGVPERAPEGRGWPGLAGSMKAQIRANTRIRGRDWADLRRPDEKNARRGPRRACEWRCS
jgi:hypothetical protein